MLGKFGLSGHHHLVPIVKLSGACAAAGFRSITADRFGVGSLGLGSGLVPLLTALVPNCSYTLK